MTFSEASSRVQVVQIWYIVSCKATKTVTTVANSRSCKSCVINQITKIIVRYSVRMKVDMYLWARELLPAGCFVERGAKQLQEVSVTRYKVWRMNTLVYKCCTIPRQDGIICLNKCVTGNG